MFVILCIVFLLALFCVCYACYKHLNAPFDPEAHQRSQERDERLRERDEARRIIDEREREDARKNYRIYVKGSSVGYP